MHVFYAAKTVLKCPPVFHREASVFLKKEPQRIGPTYKKAVYKQYSDATYRTELKKPDWLGYMGPFLMAEQGDTVIVHLKNSASRPYSIHPHGLNYSKGNEGEDEDLTTDQCFDRQNRLMDGFVFVCLYLSLQELCTQTALVQS